METFLIHPKIEKTVPILNKIRFRKMTYNKKIKTKNITCNRTMHKKMTNFYEVLALRSKSVGFDEIKKAYRNMALQYHPDVCPPSAKQESTKRFVEVREAYETLSDPVSRRRYDYELGSVSNSIGFDFEVRTEERKYSFPKEVWEMQLYGLTQGSHIRLQRNKSKNYI
ncbi:chaperone protein dnaJ 20, chloroplastic-like [Mercurialis annua]|uniref:chaperone protein dnaJ 20, chloroplastic-like n=1 Tax=Mercurialis annua TaxID=3986 RepID=UPI00215EA026|nr:chaperone protein dnaJ 20, chloroplastic-like [Mercurialis annua]